MVKSEDKKKSIGLEKNLISTSLTNQQKGEILVPKYYVNDLLYLCRHTIPKSTKIRKSGFLGHIYVLEYGGTGINGKV